MRKSQILVIFSIIICLLTVLACSISFTPPDEDKSLESTAEETSPKPSGNDSELSEPIQASFPSGSDFTYIKWNCGEAYAPAELPVGIGYKWAAKTAQQVQDYLDAVTHQVEVNGSPYASVTIFSEITEHDEGYFYSQVYIYFGDLKPGKYEFQAIGSFKEKVFDGEIWYGPGTDHPSFEGSCTLIVEANGSQLAVEPQPQEQGEDNNESAPPPQQQQQPQQQPQPPAPPQAQPTATPTQEPLTFTFSSPVACQGEEFTIELSRAADVSVYLGGRVVPKKVLNNGKSLRFTIPTNFVRGYIELKGNGIYVRSNTELEAIAPRTDLAVTDLYADNMPTGKIFTRLTNRGPSEISSSVTIYCDVILHAVPGVFAITDPIHSQKNYFISIRHNETQIFDTGITNDTDTFIYDVTCTVKPTTGDEYHNQFCELVESNPANNTYSERIP